MDLEWREPLDDGGSPITGYIIEKKSRYNDWSEAGRVEGNRCKGTVSGLTEGEEYQVLKILNSHITHSSPCKFEQIEYTNKIISSSGSLL